MNHLLAPIVIGLSTGLSAAVADLSGQTHVPLEVVVPIMVFVCSLVWWLGRRLQSIEDRLQAVEISLERRE